MILKRSKRALLHQFYTKHILSKVEDDVIFEYHITVMDDEFNLGLLTIRTPEGVFETDFDK